MHDHSATICSRIKRFSPKYSGNITVYKSMQNLYQLLKYSLTNSHNWIHVISVVALHANMTPLTACSRSVPVEVSNANCYTLLYFFTALHAMQTRSSDKNSVCTSVRLSVKRVMHCDKT